MHQLVRLARHEELLDTFEAGPLFVASPRLDAVVEEPHHDECQESFVIKLRGWVVEMGWGGVKWGRGTKSESFAYKPGTWRSCKYVIAACGHAFTYHDLLIYCLKDIRIQNIFAEFCSDVHVRWFIHLKVCWENAHTHKSILINFRADLPVISLHRGT